MDFMNNIANLSGTRIAIVLFGAVIIGCGRFDEDKHNFENKVFLASDDLVTEIVLKDGVSSNEWRLNASMAIPQEEDVTATFAADYSKILDFCKILSLDSVERLPEGCYRITDAESVIKAGGVKGTDVTIEFCNLESLDRTVEYCLPVSLVSTDGAEILNGERTKYYYFREGALIDVAMDMTGFCCWPEWGNYTKVEDLKTFTFEALVNVKSFNREISTLMGIEDNFLLRLGDSGIDPDQIQIASSKKLTSNHLTLRRSKWYHIAVTFDEGYVNVYLNGNPVPLEASDAGVSSVNFRVPHSDEMGGKPRCFWIGYSYDKQRPLDALISEVRIWNKTLTQEAIKEVNHFYSVDPDSDGLVAYWKFNEGTGSVVKDWSVGGNDLTISKLSGDNVEPQWKRVSLPETE